MKKCIIFSAGTLYDLIPEIDPDDLVIAADAGLLNCKKAGVTPHLIVGDFDSAPMPDDPERVIKYPIEKDDTDTMIAIKKGLEAGYKTFALLGATGGSRSDHTLANFQCLAYLARHGAIGYIYDNNLRYTAIYNDEITLERAKDWGIISVFSMSTTSSGVTISGVQYPLKEGTLSADFPLGVSNHFTEETATISVNDGLLLIAWEI